MQPTYALQAGLYNPWEKFGWEHYTGQRTQSQWKSQENYRDCQGTVSVQTDQAITSCRHHDNRPEPAIVHTVPTLLVQLPNRWAKYTSKYAYLGHLTICHNLCVDALVSGLTQKTKDKKEKQASQRRHTPWRDHEKNGIVLLKDRFCSTCEAMSKSQYTISTNYLQVISEIHPPHWPHAWQHQLCSNRERNLTAVRHTLTNWNT